MGRGEEGGCSFRQRVSMGHMERDEDRWIELALSDVMPGDSASVVANPPGQIQQLVNASITDSIAPTVECSRRSE